jgi:hypothetical protein
MFRNMLNVVRVALLNALNGVSIECHLEERQYLEAREQCALNRLEVIRRQRDEAQEQAQHERERAEGIQAVLDQTKDALGFVLQQRTMYKLEAMLHQELAKA